jgi:hypothetical protein
MLQVGMSQVRFTIKPFYFSINLILSAATTGTGIYSASNRNEYQDTFFGVKGRRTARKADNLSAICDCQENVGSLDVSQPCGLARPVTGIARTITHF